MRILVYLVLTVPMRNGNRTLLSPRLSQDILVLTVPMRNGNTFLTGDGAGSVSSYRTYEEWKQIENNWDRYNNRVLTVPMRNGNTISNLMLNEGSSVLTVPMRNGNPVLRGDFLPCLLSFLPYL